MWSPAGANLRDKHLAQYPFKDELPVLLRHARHAAKKRAEGR
jgi:hypothetical protein